MALIKKVKRKTINKDIILKYDIMIEKYMSNININSCIFAEILIYAFFKHQTQCKY